MLNAPRVAEDRLAIGVGDVVGVDGLEPQSRMAGDHGDPLRSTSRLGRNGPTNRRRAGS
jgi:hypothetical protein